jgi:GH24 family phage-related lysozyme (muramidase)
MKELLREWKKYISEQTTPGRISNSYSENLITFLKKEEGFREYPYKNPGDRPTIGYGTTFYIKNKKLIPVTLKDPPITPQIAEKYMRDYLNLYVMPNINRYFKNVPMTQNQIDALISVAYNRGNSGLLNTELFTVASKNPNDSRIRELFLSDNLATVAGKVEPGLKVRRKKEWELYSNNDNVDLERGQTIK